VTGSKMRSTRRDPKPDVTGDAAVPVGRSMVFHRPLANPP
jgi:hypothetical protein